MAAGREVVLRITANVTSLRAGMLSAAASVKDFEGQVIQVAKTSNETQRIAGQAMLGVGVAAAAGLALAVRSAVQFEQRMRNVSTISGDVEKNFDEAGDAILEMSGRLGVGANELAEALYDVASAGFQGAAGMHIVEVAGVAAQAGLSTAAVAAKAITGALNAYGLAASSAGDVSDIFFQTVNLGIVTFEELAQNVGDFMGTSNALGIALDDAAASFATITLAGIPASEAATSLNAVMTQMLSPSKELAAMLSSLGYESGQAAVDALGLAGTLQLMRTATTGNSAAFAALFPEVRAMKGALAITADEGSTYNRVAGEITDENKRAGAAAEALAKQQKSLGAQLKIAKEQITALAISIGQSLLPALRPIVGLVQNVATGFAALGGGAQTGVAALGLLGAGVLTIGGAFLLLAPKIAAAVKWFQLLRVEAPLLAGSLTTVTVAMGVIGIAMVAATFLLSKYGAAKKKARESVDAFKASLDAETGAITKNTAGEIAKRITTEGLDKTAAKYGLTVETVARAMKGEADAIAEVNRALDAAPADVFVDGEWVVEAGAVEKFRSAVVGGTKDLATAQAEWKRDAEVLGQVGKATGIVTDATTGLAGAADEATDSQKALLKSLQGMVSLSDIYTDGQKELEDVEKKANKAQGDRIRDSAKATVDAMGKRHKAEKDALDAETITGKASQKAHDQRVKDLEARQEKEKEAADVTVESEKKRAEAIEDADTKSKLSLTSYLKMIEDATKARLARTRNLGVIKARGGSDEAIAELAKLPAEYSGVIEEIASTSEAGFAHWVKTAKEGSEEAAATTKAEFDLLPNAIGLIGGKSGKAFADTLLEQVRLGLVPLPTVVAMGLEVAKASAAVTAAEAMVPVPGQPGTYRPRGGGPTATFSAEGHFAQIAPAGAWRVWAEPETGGEAYIPLAPSKRGRSMALLAQVAGQFGAAVVPMAGGGTWGVPAYSAGGQGAAIEALAREVATLSKSAGRAQHNHFNNTFPQGVDPLHVARKIAWQVG